MSKTENITNIEINELYNSVFKLISDARKRVAVYVNAETTLLNFKVGEYINTFILEGDRAAYGKFIILKLSEQLNLNFGSGWSEKHLRHCLRSAETIKLDAYKNPYIRERCNEKRFLFRNGNSKSLEHTYSFRAN